MPGNLKSRIGDNHQRQRCVMAEPPTALRVIRGSAQNSAGIQTLLDAEREAQKIVQQDRTKRIRDAKAEAQKEIDEYRQQKEEEFKKFEAEHSSGYKKAEEDANKEAEVKLQDIQAAGKEKGGKVVDDLINAVVDVKPQASDKIKA
ncbi:uncharacterized protein P174DRAFT_377206 [Aspergillus novofumigatus IBT 16806]|uniref:V-type proton ATPase subunit G n=1 Tax=Aspergillus novofumigatus (strain IBT 16806) TaxID=1392255 RepID=A0A2I1BY67_ASPN1|nr:uncharacterized protein P174DRAFT_377206 [Aspergillus novofumigatus IBT 16806]PKX90319.1 hypothetical protein P174DRAFT_377206 [Aspergillus novofumigatus IBT 16806]